MSKETAMAFIKASENDSVLQEKIKAADNPAKVVKIAAEYGYELTEQEIQAIKRSRIDEEDTNLSEKQLETVAGGMQQLAVSCGCDSGSCHC